MSISIIFLIIALGSGFIYLLITYWYKKHMDKYQSLYEYQYSMSKNHKDVVDD